MHEAQRAFNLANSLLDRAKLSAEARDLLRRLRAVLSS